MVMQRHNISQSKALFNIGTKPKRQHSSRIPSVVPISFTGRICVRLRLTRGNFDNTIRQRLRIRVDGQSQGELFDEDEEDLCPVECVREFKTDDEFRRILETAKETGSLVVVDFYRTSCGSCKYIEQGFSKLCKGAGDRDAAVIFFKHNVSIQCLQPVCFLLPRK